MRKLFVYLLFFVLLPVVFSCESEDDNELTPLLITADSFSTTINENPMARSSIGTVNASSSEQGAINFGLSTQSVPGAMAIDASSGELTVADSASFDFESNATITATYTAKSGSVSEEGAITVTITDVDETAPVIITAVDFTDEITENPPLGAIIGSLTASASDSSSITYSLTAQNVIGAIAIDSPTGELTVADSAAFDFEINTIITATYSATNGTVSEQGTITINISDLDDTGFITTWETTSANESINIPTNADYTYNYDIDWGDGNTSTGQTGDASHEYNSAGNYKVKITGEFPAIYFLSDFSPSTNVIAARNQIQSIDQWSNIEWQSMYGAFYNCKNLNITAKDSPDLSNTTDLSYMFFGASSFNHNINNWDVSNVTSMQFMFAEASSFNKPLNNWDLGNVTSIDRMFQDASDFNQDIGNWDVSNIKLIYYMFAGATSFNQDIGDWDVSNVTNMGSMFAGASSFNQPLNNWDVSNVKFMFNLFSGASSFNQPLNDWDVSNVTNMSKVFQNATNFNQDIDDWDVSNVTDMSYMFFNASSFNKSMIDWEVDKVTDMFGMFDKATNFNQDISSWNVSNVTRCDNFSDDSGLITENIPNFTNCNPE